MSSWKEKNCHETVKNEVHPLAAGSSAVVFDGIGYLGKKLIKSWQFIFGLHSCSVVFWSSRGAKWWQKKNSFWDWGLK